MSFRVITMLTGCLLMVITIDQSVAQSAKTPGAAGRDKRPAQASVPKREKPANATFGQLPDPVALVDGVEIRKAELDRAVSTVLAQSGRSESDIPDEQRSETYRMILDDLIIDKLITKRAGTVKISDAEVETAFKRSTANFGSDEEVKSQIEKSGQTVEEVKENIRSMLRQRQWVESQLTESDEVTDGEAEDFYRKNPEQFKMPERVRASHILLVVKPDASPEAVIEREKAAQTALARIKKGEDFKKVAQELSEDPTSKQNGGDLDFFTREQMVPEFSDAAFEMKKEEISDPIRSQFGYHIIKVTDRKPPESVSLESARPQLVAYLRQQKKQVEVERLVRGIRETADVKVHLLPGIDSVARQPVRENALPK